MAFYVSNRPVTAARAAESSAHWTIENTSHYSRDVTLREDRSRIRTNPGVFARLRSFAFNILKAIQTDTMSRTATAPVSQASKSYSECSPFVALNSPVRPQASPHS